MGFRTFFIEYLSFTRKDLIAVAILFSLLVIVFFSPQLFRSNNSSRQVQTDTAWISAVKKLEVETSQTDNRGDMAETGNASYYQYDRTSNAYFAAGKPELFYFDPNKLTTEGWKKLGLRDKTIHTIQNYLAKGGHFYKPDDLGKIYGLRKEDFERLKPFIRIEQTHSNEHKPFKETTSSFAKTSRYQPVDINDADTTAFIALPGIGSKLAARIVNFRDKLGGFHSISQVAETFGLPDSTFQKIKEYLMLENSSVKKININTATVDELKAHPYIRYSIANPIVAYRNEHGPFSKLEDLKKVMVVTEEVYNKVAPYLTTQ